MKVNGEAVLHAPVERVWEALLDPAVLVRTIPGCERLEATGENAYAMTVTAGVASIRGTYSGTCVLSDLRPHEALTMTLQGAGGPGTIGAEVAVGFVPGEDGSTRLTYAADAVVGGMVGGVGQRMLTSVSKRTAAEFFGAVEDVLSGKAPAPVGAEGAAADTAAGVYTAPPRAAGEDRFWQGVALGAGLVLLGVVAGSALGRRR